MNSHDNPSLSRVREAIQVFVLSRRDSFPISIADMRRRVRFAMPGIGASDEELSELIAGAVIEAGGNVAFDSRARQDGQPADADPSQLGASAHR